ncbi:AraC family transcriptional regulator [Exercitatus varius]|uniref:AraC family transcriptional regulator n=1 Tax=Exercitatus varius TaxID=67857 RepID=UPI00294B3EE6|nr:AraC family transcriptional regulator [Exercitatus varius]MDG2941372.1 AraC family transcriptional regulator [Exercitatus varius]
MNMIRAFNRTVDYLEKSLSQEPDEKEITRLSGYSFAMFSRLFSILTEMTLSEYLRRRKLTEAAIRLRETDDKIIDIALDYGYESPDSFGLAFKKFHGCSPSSVRKGERFNIVSRVQLSLSITGGSEMNISIQKKPAFTVAGIGAKSVSSAECAGIWEKLYRTVDEADLKALGNGQCYGMCYDVEQCNSINYLACYHVENGNEASAEKLGLQVVAIPEAEYAVVELVGEVPQSIHKGWKYVTEVFFPESGYKHSGKPDFEVYSGTDIHNEQYKMELWIPVEKD